MWFLSSQPIGEKHFDGPEKRMLNHEWNISKDTM